MTEEDLDKLISGFLENPQQVKRLQSIIEYAKLGKKMSELNRLKLRNENIIANNYFVVAYSKKDKDYKTVLAMFDDCDLAQKFLDRKIGVTVGFNQRAKLKKRRGYFYVIEEISEELKKCLKEDNDKIDIEIENLEKEAKSKEI